MGDGDYESVILVKPEVFVFRIPPLSSGKGHKAADWKLDAPDWTGRMRIVAKGAELVMKLEDKSTGELFAKCPIDKYPGVAVESVTDSSRYFVIRLQDEQNRSAFIGIGFADRSDSFDLNVSLQDHFKYLEKTEKLQKESADNAPKLDLGFKEGQTITINLGKKEDGGTSTPRSRPRAPGASGAAPVPLLPPPPGSKNAPVTGKQSRGQPPGFDGDAKQKSDNAEDDLWGL